MKILALTFLICPIVTQASSCVDENVLLDQSQISETNMGSYLLKDHSCPPRKENQTEVEIRLYIIQIRSGASQDMSFSLYLFHSWRDDRMKFKTKNPDDYYVVHRKNWNNIWMPHVFIENDLNTQVINSQENSFLWIYPNGTMRYGTRMSATIDCPTEKIRFPKGYLSCQLHLNMNSYERRAVSLIWAKSHPILFAENYERDRVILQDWKLTVCDHKNARVLENSCIELQMKIQKHFTVSMLRLYLPSIFIVIVGWLSFWIDRNEVSSRVKLGTLCLLSMITEEIGISMLLPDEIYVLEIEIWFSVCLAFVTFAMCEFALVHAIDKFQAKIKKNDWKIENEIEECRKLTDEKHCDVNKCNVCNNMKNTNVRLENRTSSYSSNGYKIIYCCYIKRLSTGKIENFCKIIYAIAFTLFQASYWLHYLYVYSL